VVSLEVRLIPLKLPTPSWIPFNRKKAAPLPSLISNSVQVAGFKVPIPTSPRSGNVFWALPRKLVMRKTV